MQLGSNCLTHPPPSWEDHLIFPLPLVGKIYPFPLGLCAKIDFVAVLASLETMQTVLIRLGSNYLTPPPLPGRGVTLTFTPHG